jgi:hypothetical protein
MPASEPPQSTPIDVLRVKKLLYARDIARALDSPADRWTTRRARKWLRKSGAGFQLSPRGPWTTTRQRLRERFGDVLDVVLIQLDEDGEDLV